MVLRKLLYISLIGLFIISSCKKEEVEPIIQQTEDPWARFLGEYEVYDTLGSYLYDCRISNYRDVSRYGTDTVDYVLVENFADSFNLPVQFTSNANPNTLNLGIYDSIPDNRNMHWFVSTKMDDLTTKRIENNLLNDTLVFYFKMTNIKYYINEAQPYFFCECKHVAVKK